jgi:hypothetical protein
VVIVSILRSVVVSLRSAILSYIDRSKEYVRVIVVVVVGSKEERKEKARRVN